MKRSFLLLLSILCCTGIAFSQAKKPAPKKKPAPVKTKPAVKKTKSEDVPTNAEIRKYFNDKDWAKTIEAADKRLKAFPNDQPPLVMKTLSYGMVHNKDMVLK